MSSSILPHPQPLQLKNARLPCSGAVVNVTISGGVITELVPAGHQLAHAGPSQVATGHTAQQEGSAEVLDLDGRVLLPGLWDHHVHFTQWTIQQQRLDLTDTTTGEEVLERAGRAAATTPADGCVIGFGFRDGLWPQPARLEALDAATGHIPTVLVSADLHSMWINSVAQRKFSTPEASAATDLTGLLRETPAFAVMEQLDSAGELSDQDYARAAEAAAARGVVGIIDFENDDNATLWPQRVAAGVDSLRVEVSAWPEKLDSVIDRQMKTGDVLDDQGLMTMGPLKVIVDGSLNTRTAWCWDPYPGLDVGHPHRCGMETVPIDQLESLMSRAHRAGITAAIHAIGDRANTEVLNTFQSLGMTGAIEHAQLLRSEDMPRFAELGLTASVQPEHAMDDRDVADVYWAGRTNRSFALRSLLDLGAQLRLGSDAPVAPLDPWIAIASAVHRSRDDRDPWHPEQAISITEALAASTRSQLAVGEPADLVIIEDDPYSAGRDTLRDMPVAATLVGGRFTYRAL